MEKEKKEGLLKMSKQLNTNLFAKYNTIRKNIQLLLILGSKNAVAFLSNNNTDRY